MNSKASQQIPATGLAGLKANFSADLMAGFTISLIALPLCIAIAKASGFPPMAGLIAAIIGGLLVSRISGSFVTINGPAAGLIVVNEAAVNHLGGVQYALAAILVAGGLIFLLGLLRAGKLGALFPANAVHGMLAAIGVIIIAKQIHVALTGAALKGEPLELLAEIPHSLLHLNVQAALIAGVALVILIVHPMLKVKVIKVVPAAMWVLLATVPLALWLQVPQEQRVSLPAAPLASLQFPDFAMAGTGTFWTSVIAITLVTFIETMASARAVDKLDPWRRQTRMSRDVGAMGIGSAVSASIGGLPMIAEIVRSSANINSGARSSWANFFHGAFLLVFVLLLSPVINLIPNAALAAMLVFTGFRLASPKNFAHAWHIGWDQLVVFLVTLVVTLATDLLIGIGAGILAQFLLNVAKGSGPATWLRADLQAETQGTETVVTAGGSLQFLNYIGLENRLQAIPDTQHVVLNLGQIRLADHSTLENLHELQRRMYETGRRLDMTGLDALAAFSHHPLSGRYRGQTAPAAAPPVIPPNWDRLARKYQGSYAAPMLTSYRDLTVYTSLTGISLKYESQVLAGRLGDYPFRAAVLDCKRGGFGESDAFRFTAVTFEHTREALPAFLLEPEAALDRLLDFGVFHDIDFGSHPQFSDAYRLYGADEAAIRAAFTPRVLSYLEQFRDKGYVLECTGTACLCRRGFRVLTPEETEEMLEFLNGMLLCMQQRMD